MLTSATVRRVDYGAILLGGRHARAARGARRDCSEGALRPRSVRQPASFSAAGVDFMVVRRPGHLAGRGGFLRRARHRIATQGSVNTRMESGAASASRSIWPAAALASTSPSCTRRTCSRSRATCGSAPSAQCADYPTSTPRTATSARHASTSCKTRSADVIVTDNLFGASSPTSVVRCRGIGFAVGEPQRTHGSVSLRAGARRRRHRDRTRQTRSPRSCPRR